jgi:predicted regulator of Ras-like GTPase activity (Roadblock/LC7/MglB family)
VREANLSEMTEAQTALAELTEISSQVEAAVLFDSSGAVTGATIPDEAAARLASSARALLESAAQIRDGELTQIEAATGDGSLFIARDGERLIAAVTRPEPTAGRISRR